MPYTICPRKAERGEEGSDDSTVATVYKRKLLYELSYLVWIFGHPIL